MARKLKVFQAQFGFHDTVVAAPSQATALRAWGAHQDLFHDGQARVATDQAAIDAAPAAPNVPLRRAIGSDDPFSLNPGLPKLPDLPHGETKSRSGAAKSRPNAHPSSKPVPKLDPPDRSAVDVAEAAVKALSAARVREEQSFRKRREALAAEEGAAFARYDDDLAQAKAVLQREKRAFDDAKKRYDRNR